MHKTKIFKWKTFEGVVKNIYEIDHQHLSNIHFFINLTAPEWYDDSTKTIIENELRERFNGKVMPYRPLRRFKAEMDNLQSKGYLVPKKDGDGHDIIVDGDWIGEVDESLSL